jgi:hypothetical protein
MAQLSGATAQPSPPSVGEAFSWAFKDPEWVSKVLLMGLIGIIPIVGALQLAGWLLAMLDNLRAGRNEIPSAGFRYATRGVWLWLAGLIYGIGLFLILWGSVIIFVAAVGLVSQAGQRGDSANPLALLLIPFFLVWFGVTLLVSLALWIFVPAVILFTDRRGLSGAFDIPGIIRAVRLDPPTNLAAAGLTLLVYFISGLGAYLCWIGVIFTSPYALTVLAGVLRWYELSVKPESPPAPSAALAR